MTRRLRPSLLLATTLAVALALAGCGSSGDTPSTTATGGTAGAFPVTVPGAFGTATVPRAPKRVVTIGWSDQDVALALGVVPVAVNDIGPDFPTGVGPWGAAQLKGAKPTKIAVSDGVPYERVASLHPDLILAVQSGITKADYSRLSQIAPTITYQKGRKAFLTPWPEQTRVIGRALGKEEQAQKLVDRTDAKIEQARQQLADVKGATFSYIASVGGRGVNAYIPGDLRVQLMERLGLRLSPGQRQVARGNAFAVPVSLEQLSLLDADVLVAWFNSADDRKALVGRREFQRLPVVRDGRFVSLDLVQAQAQGAPTVLSIPWTIDRIVPRIVAAAKKGAAESQR